MGIAFFPVPGSFRCSKSDRIVAGLCWFCQFFSVCACVFAYMCACVRSVRVPFYVPLFPSFLFSSSSVNGIYMAVICQHFYNKSTPKRNQQHNKFNIGNLLWFSTKISNISEMSHGVAFFPHDIFVSFMLKGKPNLAAIFFLGTVCLNTLSLACLTLNWNSFIQVYGQFFMPWFSFPLRHSRFAISRSCFYSISIEMIIFVAHACVFVTVNYTHKTFNEFTVVRCNNHINVHNPISSSFQTQVCNLPIDYLSICIYRHNSNAENKNLMPSVVQNSIYLHSKINCL